MHRKHTAVTMCMMCVAAFIISCPSSLSAADSAAAVCPSCPPPSALDPENRKIAEDFLRRLSERPVVDIHALTLCYHFYMDIDWKVRLRMRLFVELQKKGHEYHAGFRLTEPVGDNLWGKFIMFIHGRHTKKYRKMVQGIKTRLHENFHLRDGTFVTDRMIEISPDEKKKEKQRGYKIVFDYRTNRIRFWKDQRKKDFTLSAGYRNQTGPLTAFFNYFLLGLEGNQIDIINLEQTKYPRASKGNAVQQTVKADPFPSQTLSLKPNRLNRHRAYTDCADLGCEDFFDIVYGTHIYFNYVHDQTAGLRMPYASFFEGIIDKKKKRARTRKIVKLRKSKLDSETYERRLAEIKRMEIRAAKNIVGKLVDATVEYRPSIAK